MVQMMQIAKPKMSRVLLLVNLIFLLAGCADSSNYARRDQLSVGMNKQDLAKIKSTNPFYICERLHSNDDKYVVYRIFLKDTDGQLKPYFCTFSRDGVLNSIRPDLAYENSAIERATNEYKGHGKWSDPELPYWSK